MCEIGDAIVLLLLGICSISDWKKKTIPMVLLVFMSVIVLIIVMICKDVSIRLRIGGGFLGFVFLLISKCTKEAIGYGDSWLIMILGIHLGSLQTIEVLFVASVLAGIVSLFCLWRCRWKRNATLPFVPFLCISYLGVMLL